MRVNTNQIKNKINNEKDKRRKNIAKIFHNSFLKLKSSITSVDIKDIEFVFESEMFDSSEGIRDFVDKFIVDFKYNEKFISILKDKDLNTIQKEFEDDGILSIELDNDIVSFELDKDCDDITLNEFMSKNDADKLYDYLYFLKDNEDDIYDCNIESLNENQLN